MTRVLSSAVAVVTVLAWAAADVGADPVSTRPGLVDALGRRASFTRSHRGPFASPLEGDAADSSGTPAAWHAGDRVLFAWHDGGRVLFAAFDPRGDVLVLPEELGRGAWPRLAADGTTTAVAWRSEDRFLLRVLAHGTWSAQTALEGSDPSLAFDPSGVLHVATSTGLWALRDGRLERVREAAWAHPSLAFDAAGTPHVAHEASGRVRVDDEDLGSGERPSLLAGSDGALHVAHLTGGKVVVRTRRESWGSAKQVPGKEPAWPALAWGAGGARVTFLGAADRGPTALWLATLSDPKPVLVPSVAGNVTRAWLLVSFHLRSPRGGYRPHDVSLVLNDIRIATFEDTVLEGRYLFPLEPWQVLVAGRAPVLNRIGVVSRHGNGGHYTVSTDYELVVHTSWSERYGFGAAPAEVARASGGPATNEDQPDLAILANDVSLPVARPAPGPIPLPVVLVNLGVAASRPTRLEVKVGGRLVETKDVEPLEPGERRTVPLALEWDGRADAVEIGLRGPRDFQPSNDTMRLSLWPPERPPTASGAGTARPTGKAAPEATATLRLVLPAGLPEPDFLLRDARGQETVLTVAPWASKHEAQYPVPHGEYVLDFAQRALTTFPVRVKEGESAVLDLAATAGVVKVVPFQGLPQPAFDFRRGEETVRTVAAWAVPAAEAYLAAPGEYRIRFHGQYLSDLPVRVEAGRESVIELEKALGKLRVTTEGRRFEGETLVQEPSGTTIRTLAWWGTHFADVYGLLPGRYRLVFHRRYGTPVDLEVKAGETLDLDLDRTHGYLAFVLPEGVTEYRVLGEDGKLVTHVAAWALPPEERIGLAPGRYGLSNDRLPVPVPVTIEVGRVARVALGEQLVKTTLVFPEKGERPTLVVRDAQGKEVGQAPTWSLPKDASIYLPPGRWTLALGGYRPVDVEASPDHDLRVEPVPAEPGRPAGVPGGAGTPR